jgi:hypothetical protein
LVGAASLGYPLGRDQALPFYVAREWLEHGARPYRDLIDASPPGLYALHAVALGLFGHGPHAIRLLEWLVLLPSGLACAHIAGKAERGMCGFATLALAIGYYGLFDYWNTAQGELVCGALCMVPLWVTQRPPSRALAFVAGAAAGAAVCVRPWCAPLALVAVGAFGWHRRSKEAVGLLALGLLAVPLLLLVYLGAAHALDDAYDLLYDGRCLYQLSPPLGIGGFVDRAVEFYTSRQPLTSVLLATLIAGAVFAAQRGDLELRGAHLRALALLAAATLSVALTGKAYDAHWAIGALPFAVALTVVVRSVRAWLGAQLGFRVALVHLVLAFALSSGSTAWYRATSAVLSRLRGRASEEEAARAFDLPHLDFRPSERLALVAWLQANTDPRDHVAIRGFEPDLYATSGRSYGGRFFYTQPLVTGACLYRRGEWLERYREELARLQPPVIITLPSVDMGPDSREFYAGTHSEGRIGGFDVLR